MPKLLVRGCALEGCHSPDGFNDFRLRSGAFGFFAPAALTPQLPRAGRRVHGLRHRRRQAVARGEEEHRPPDRAAPPTGPGRSSRTRLSATDPCPQPFDPATNTRAFCVLAGLAPDSSAQDRGRRRLADERWRRAAAGVRVAAAQRRRPAALRHLRGRRRSQARRRHRRRQRPGHRGRQRAQRARALRGPRRPGRRRARPRVELRRTKLVFAARPGAGERPRSVAARRGRGDLPAAHQ